MKISKILAIGVVALSLASCSSYKNVSYFQNIDEISLDASKGLYDARIMPKDELTITVNTTDREVSMQFNQLVYNTLTNTNRTVSTAGGSLMPYLVANDGTINFPIIGKVHVQGLTKEEAQDKIAGLIKPYLASDENPIVLVRMSSYHVTVMGEVAHPCIISVAQEKMSILEALAQAGDLTIYGVRDNVILIREDETGQKHQFRLNLNDANIINSPYYYLKQNDIIYVTPNETKAKNSDIGQSTTLWFSATSILISLTSLLYNILK